MDGRQLTRMSSGLQSTPGYLHFANSLHGKGDGDGDGDAVAVAVVDVDGKEKEEAV